MLGDIFGEDPLTKRGIQIFAAAALLAGVSTPAMAGGFSRGTADTDILFEEGPFAMRSFVTIVSPDRTYSENPNPALVGEDYAKTYLIPSFAVKYDVGENLSCAGTAVQAYGAASFYSSPTPGAGKLLEEFTVTEFGATCAGFVQIGQGRAFLLGGVFQEKFDYDLVAFAGALDTELESEAYGWRLGVGYEIPDIALRAQVLYRSGTEHEADGTAGISPPLPVPGPLTLPATGSGELPQSVELRVQSGIAPGWLAFGSAKWTDWSVNETLDLDFTIGDSLNSYFWRDGWTITGGIGHSFTDELSGLVSFTWDRGVSTGWDYYGDTYTVATGASLKDQWGGQLRAGLALAYQGDVEAPNDFGGAGGAIESGWAVAGQLGYSIRW